MIDNACWVLVAAYRLEHVEVVLAPLAVTCQKDSTVHFTAH
jgi:hypothetical protein